MKLGISGQALGEVKSFAEIVKIGKSLGVFDYEIWPVNVPGGGWGYINRDINTIKHVIQQEGVRVGCVTIGDAFNVAISQKPDEYSDALCSAIEAAKLLEADCVNHYCYHISMGEPDFARMEQFWSKPLRLAESLQIVLALENEAHDSTALPESMLSIVNHFDSPFFKTNFDATNYFHASCEGYPRAYEILKNHIGYVHLKNGCLYQEGMPQQNTGAPMTGYHSPAPIQYTQLQDGSLNMAGLLYRLRHDGTYNGLCTLEPHTKPEYVEEFYINEVTYLRTLGIFKIND